MVNLYRRISQSLELGMFAAQILLLDHIRALLADHDAGGIGVGPHNIGHDAGIDHPQTLGTMDLQLGIHHGSGIAGWTHASGAHG